MSNEENNTEATEAEERKTQLEADLLELELKHKKAEEALSELELQNKKERIALQGMQTLDYQRDHLLSAAKNNQRVYDFDDHVDEMSARSIIGVLRAWERADEVDGVQRDILIRLKSPGGSVIDGFDIFDHIRGMQDRGYTVNTEATGIAASMAGVLLQAGTVRMIKRNAFLHLHEVSTMSFGKAAELKDQQTFTEALQTRICEIYAERSGGVHTAETVLGLFERREVYLKATEALEHGFVDGVL